MEMWATYGFWDSGDWHEDGVSLDVPDELFEDGGEWDDEQYAAVTEAVAAALLAYDGDQFIHQDAILIEWEINY